MNIRDPIHGQIEFSDIEQEIIDCLDFQRLRQIRQVAMTYLVYPGAHHTRFEHSLGTMHLASKIGQKIGLNNDELSQLRLCALLHDIGHMPFSHDCESILSPTTGTHEQIGKKLITHGQIHDILSKNFDSKNIAQLMLGKSFGQVLTCDVGADRLDYLLRDAHYTGVAYGVIDWSRIIAKMIYKSSKIQIEKGGIEATESVILARFSMFHAVYYHHAVRIARKMLQVALKNAVNFEQIDPNVISRYNDNSLLDLLLRTKSSSALCARLINRKLLKRAYVVSWANLNEDTKNYILSHDFENDLSKRCPDALVDIPSQFKSQVNVLINDNNVSRNLCDISSISSSLESASLERATLLVLCEDSKRKRVANTAKKLLNL